MTTLQNKVAIVTGSTSGIGEATARLLSENGVKVVINSAKSIEKGEAISATLDNSAYCQANIAVDVLEIDSHDVGESTTPDEIYKKLA